MLQGRLGCDEQQGVCWVWLLSLMPVKGETIINADCLHTQTSECAIVFCPSIQNASLLRLPIFITLHSVRGYGWDYCFTLMIAVKDNSSPPPLLRVSKRSMFDVERHQSATTFNFEFRECISTSNLPVHVASREKYSTAPSSTLSQGSPDGRLSNLP